MSESVGEWVGECRRVGRRRGSVLCSRFLPVLQHVDPARLDARSHARVILLLFLCACRGDDFSTTVVSKVHAAPLDEHPAGALYV